MHWILFCDNASWEWHGVTVHQHRLPKWCHWARGAQRRTAILRLDGRANLEKGPCPRFSRCHPCAQPFCLAWARKLARQWPKVKWVLDIAENLPEIMQEYDHVKRGLGRWIIRPSRWAELQARALNDADHVVLVTQAALADYTDRLGLMPDKGVICDNVPWDDHIGMEGLDGLERRFADAFVLFYFETLRVDAERIWPFMPCLASSLRCPMPNWSLSAKTTVEDIDVFLPRVEVPVARGRSHPPRRVSNRWLPWGPTSVLPMSGCHLWSETSITTPPTPTSCFTHGRRPSACGHDCPAQANLVTTTNTGLVHRGGDVDSLVGGHPSRWPKTPPWPKKWARAVRRPSRRA